MKKHIFSFFLFLLSLPLFAQQAPAEGNNNKYNAVSYRSLPALSLEAGGGLSGAYSGSIGGDALLVAGGCNFPDTPAAEGGTKTYYDAIYALESLDGTGEWKQVGTLPKAAAYGVGVSSGRGSVIIAGGTDGANSLSEVYEITLKDGKAEVAQLPSLPVALDNMAGAYGSGCLYIAGGQSNGAPSLAAFCLKDGAKEWQRLPDLPGAPRLQPTAAVQNGSTGANFYLLGGYAPAIGSTRGAVHHDGVIYNPQTNTWKPTATMKADGVERSLVGAAAAPSGCAHIVCFGGVNEEIFENAINRPAEMLLAQTNKEDSVFAKLEAESKSYLLHDAAWYKFNDEILIYHTITDTWVTESRSPLLARAGAALIPCGGEWFVVGGESKPGIRATEATAVKMSAKPDFGWLNWTVLVLYLLGMLALGFYFMRREGDSGDFFTGGGRIPWWAAGISIYATMLSAITYMAYPAKAFATDWTYYPMLVTILLVSFPVVRYYLPFFRRLNVTSAYEYLEHRFNAATRLMASALFIVFMVARSALVLYLPSLALTAVTGIDIYICIILMAVITIVYCTMGGVEAVVWGDVVQGIILVGGAFLAVGYLAFGTEGGVNGFFDIAIADDKFRLFDWSLDYRSANFWVFIIGGHDTNLISYTSDQTVIQRYLTTKDEREARRSIMMNGAMSVFISIAFFAIGAGLYTFFKTHPAELDYTMAKADIIFPFFMMSQLPAGIAGLLIAAIFAATMSTISSNINSISTAFSIDFYKRFRPATSDKQMLSVARCACLIAGILGMSIALLMATWEILSLLDFFQEILGLLSSGLGGLFLMGIFFPRIGGKSALIGFCSGVAAVFLVKNFSEASFLLYGAIGMVVSVLVAWICSFIFREQQNLKGLTWKTLEGEK